jgi:hypothetical protein
VRTRKETGRALAAILLSAALLPAAEASAAEVDFYAVVDREQLGVEDTLTLTVTLSEDAHDPGQDDLKLPEAPDFDVLSRTQSSRMEFSMSGTGPPTFRKVREFTVLLSPRRPGTFVFKPGQLTRRGKVYETGAIKVKVTSGTSSRRAHRAPPSPPPTQPNNPFGLPGFPGGLLGGNDEDAEELLNQFFGASRPASDSDLYVRTFLDKKQATLGEQVTFSTYLFARVDIGGVDNFKMPKLDGFWSEDLESPQQITGELRTIDGVAYRVFLLRKRALFPIKSGRQTIDPVEVDISTGFGLVLSGRKLHRTSAPLSVDVAPLPPGAPPSFSGTNVGQWRLTADANPTSVPLGQPLTFKVVLEGTGNLHDIVVPKLARIAGLKAYDPTVTEKVVPSKGRFGGRRTLEYLLMPEQTGTFELPALSMAYFDPAAKAYQTTTTQLITVRVEPGTGAAATASGPSGPAAGAPADRAVNVLGAAGLRPLRYKAELARPAPPAWRRPFFLPVAASPLALWAGLQALGLARAALARGDSDGRKRKAGSRARRRLKRANALLASREIDAFYAEVSRALGDYLSDKLLAPVAGLTRAELLARLTAAGLGPAGAQRLCAVLDTCDAGRFAPGAGERRAMERLLAEALLSMQELEAARLTVGGVRVPA